MSTPLGSSQWMYASGEEVPQQSLKFNDDESQYLSWTPAAAGNRRTWTWSGWVKRGKISGSGYSVLFGASSSLTNNDQLLFRMTNDEGQLFWRQEVSGIGIAKQNSIALFRDPSAWYHIVMAYDSTNATEVDRIKIYVNGVRIELDNDNKIEEDRETQTNNTVAHHIGYAPQVSDYFDGYMSDIHFIDGQALDSSSFGETVDGYWKAKDYDGTYGQNGYRLTFADDVVSKGFNVATYRGNSGTQSISGLGLSPDFVWIKSRQTGGYSHRLFDSVRGATKGLASNGTNSEFTDSGVTSFDADGFTLGSGVNSNRSDYNYVAWAWDAGSGSATLNEDGSIDSTVKANPSYGFSIVKWVGDGTSQGATVGHSLGVTPSMFIVKSTDSTASWNVWHKDLTNATTSRLILDDTDDEFDSVYVWGSTAPNNSAFGVGTSGSTTWTNRLDRNYIAYCFAEVAGYSSIGSYTGSGVSGKAVTGLGFQPAWLMIKRTDGGTNGWMIYDSTRDTVNDRTLRLKANVNDNEDTGDAISFDSDGFTLNATGASVNGSTDNTYIYMAFADTREAAFWKDVSGQGNHWTPNNLDYRDSLPDSPANNFGTLNPLSKDDTSVVYSEGNLQAINSTSTSRRAYSTIAVKAGKWYLEYYVNAIGSSTTSAFGVQQATDVWADGLRAYRANGNYFNGSGWASYGATFTTGDIISFAVDYDSDTIEFFKNGASQGKKTSVGFDASYDYVALINLVSGFKATVNFGQDSTFSGAKPMGAYTDGNSIGNFQYAPPAGYLALCTANLPEPTIVDGSEHFNTVLYTGDNADRNIDVGFKSDFVWLKQRSSPDSHHRLYDSVRGDGQTLFSSLANDEADGVDDGVDFTYADGFNIDAGANVQYYNGSGRTYASWNWKAGSTAVLNEVGTIDSQVSANTTAGFSIVSYTGTGSNATVGHGLSQPVEIMLVKERTSTSGWFVYTSPTGAGKYLSLHSPADESSSTASWNNTAPTESVFSVGTSGGTNQINQDYICYAFHSVEGYSKVGSYIGGGSNFPFVFTGFRPAWVMIKSSAGTSQSWEIRDNKREPFNDASRNVLFANTADDETVDAFPIDFTSNGFKVRNSGTGTNLSGATYIYLAFAEHPFKYANAR